MDQSENRSLFIYKGHLSIGQSKLLSLALFTCGFLAVQRFTLSPINTAICVLPLFLFAVQMLRGHHQSALTYLVLSLFLSIDNGGGAYAETITPLRYLIYLSAITMLFYLSNWRVRRKRLLLAALLCCGIAFGCVTTAFGSVPLDVSTLQRDLMVLFILSAFLFDRSSAKLDLHLLFSGSLGYLAGEFVNALFLYKDFAEYLSYNSLKAFVVFPVIYALLTRRNAIIKVALVIPTLYVIFLYGSRMITLSAFVFLAAALFINVIKNRSGKSQLGFLVLLVLLANFYRIEALADYDVMRFKALSFLVQIQENFEEFDIFSLLVTLDPVRFAVHQLFFDRPILEVMFGSGIGSGMFDADGLLAFVTVDQSAFSEQEINYSTFYNLHDFWIDFGLRFGLLPLAYVINKIVLQ